MLGRFEEVRRLRPVDLVRPVAGPLPAVPCLAVAQPVAGAATRTGWRAEDGTEIAAHLDRDGVRLEVRLAGVAETHRHRSRRHGRPEAAPDSLALTLTGPHLVAWTLEAGRWRVRARVDLAVDHGVEVHREDWLASLRPDAAQHGLFGQVGLRDLRLVTEADGTAYRAPDLPADHVLLTATSAGPGAFSSGHCSVWALDTARLELTHRADLFFRRRGAAGTGVFGDHAVHLLHHEGQWLVAASTWGDFDKRRPGASVGVTLAESSADLTQGVHLLDSSPLPLPTDGLTSVGVWDPHLVLDDDRWLVGYVSASRFFRFHPVLAEGPALDRLALRAAAARRTATEGTTLHRDPRVGDGWLVLASDGRDGRRGQRERYPVFDLDLTEIGALDAPYPTNIPWPTLVPSSAGLLMVGFDTTPSGGPLVGYGSHGDVVLARQVATARTAG
ncbi:hypothetical protein [Nocardioides nanhaiensis]|uniref:Uncharacterized protein n=1 Tax=Nocardioides nanhaiensis TaxID=1476871 RepID=A0ABP8WAF0_9ACTN